MDHKCKNDPKKFCHICRYVVLPNLLEKVTDFVKKTYHDFLVFKFGNQDMAFAYPRLL